MKPIPTLAAAAFAGSLAFTAPAHAATSWSVSIAGPGYAVAAGPAYYGPAYFPHRYWHRAYVPAPVVAYPAPAVYPAPRVVYRAPVVYAPVYPAPRVVYSAPVVVRPW